MQLSKNFCFSLPSSCILKWTLFLTHLCGGGLETPYMSTIHFLPQQVTAVQKHACNSSAFPHKLRFYSHVLSIHGMISDLPLQKHDLCPWCDLWWRYTSLGRVKRETVLDGQIVIFASGLSPRSAQLYSAHFTPSITRRFHGGITWVTTMALKNMSFQQILGGDLDRVFNISKPGGTAFYKPSASNGDAQTYVSKRRSFSPLLRQNQTHMRTQENCKRKIEESVQWILMIDLTMDNRNGIVEDSQEPLKQT